MYSIVLTAFSFLIVWIMELMYSIYCVGDEYYDCIFFFTICLHGLHVVMGYGGFSGVVVMGYVGDDVVWVDGYGGWYLLCYYWHFVDGV